MFFIDYFVVDINIDRLNENDIGVLSKWMVDLPLMKRYEWTEFGFGRCLREALHQENILLEQFLLVQIILVDWRGLCQKGHLIGVHI